MNYVKVLGPIFDEKTNKKIKDFCIKNEVSQSEILRVLIERSSIKINVKSKSEINRAARGGLRNTLSTRFFVSQKTLDKLEKMCEKNNASYSEITRRLVDFADLESIPFRTLREMRAEAKGRDIADKYVYRRLAYGIKLDTTLDYSTNEKIKDFALANNTIPSEILRVLLERSPIKIDVKSRKEITKDAFDGKPHNIPTHFCLPEKLVKKLENMRIENRTSYSELVRRLIETSDLNKIKFRSINEIFPTLAKSKSKKKLQKNPIKLRRIRTMLRDSTHKKLQDFVAKNNVTSSEVLRVLANDLDMKTSKEKYNLFKYPKTKNVGKNINIFCMTEETYNKLKKAYMTSQKTYSEIIGKIIDNADLESMTFSPN